MMASHKKKKNSKVLIPLIIVIVILGVFAVMLFLLVKTVKSLLTPNPNAQGQGVRYNTGDDNIYITDSRGTVSHFDEIYFTDGKGNIHGEKHIDDSGNLTSHNISPAFGDKPDASNKSSVQPTIKEVLEAKLRHLEKLAR